jgi:ElaB/YqjD/DUF883 family membrane-anchored ribosome-binding protein
MASTTAQNRSERNADGGSGRASQPGSDHLSVLNDLQCYTKQYVQEQPETAALICLGIGFILGWKLKPW